MIKLPFIQFYPSDWIRDTRGLSARSKGAWIDILCFAWNEPRRGVYKRWPDMMVRELGLSDVAELDEILAELEGVADIMQDCECKNKSDDNHECSGFVTIVSRRMLKEERVREIDRKRQREFRRHADVTKKSGFVTRDTTEVILHTSDVTTTPIVPKGTPASKVTEWFETTWKQYPKERRVGKKAAFRSYQAAVKTLEEAREVAAALANYKTTKTVQDGFIKNASTWFANWEDFKDERRDQQGTIVPPIERPANAASPGAGGFTPAARVIDQFANHHAVGNKSATEGS